MLFRSPPQFGHCAKSKSTTRLGRLGPVARDGFELEHHLSGGVRPDALVGHCRAGDVAAQGLQRLPVIGNAAHGCAQVETVDVCAQRLLEIRLPALGALHRQHPLAGVQAEGDAVNACRLPPPAAT